FDAAVFQQFDQWQDGGRWQLVDYCRYVDDMRLVIRLGEPLRTKSEKEICELVTEYLQRLLRTNAEGLTLNAEKCSVVLGRDAAAGSIRVSATMKRINHAT